MDFRKIIELQISDDKNRGFEVDFSSEQERYDQLMKDIVGLVGEIGEFSNIVKKASISLSHPEIYRKSRAEFESGLGEELADSLIYIIRLAGILQIDLETETLKKITLNKEKYRSLDKN